MMLITIVNTIAVLVGIYIVLDIVMAVGEGWMLGLLAYHTKNDDLYDAYLAFDIYADDNKGTYTGLKAKVIAFTAEASYCFAQK